MGTTLGSMHFYKTDIDKISNLFNDGNFVGSISENWITVLDDSFYQGEAYDIAKNVSKQVDSPVLLFQCYDDDIIILKLYKCGYQKAAYLMSYDNPPKIKHCASFVTELGFDKSKVKTLRNILECDNLKLKIKMLEEFFEVAFYIHTDFITEGTEPFARGNEKSTIKKYLKTQKKIDNIKNIAKVSLISETNAKLFINKETLSLSYENGKHVYNYKKSTPVEFTEGCLRPLSDIKIDRDCKVYYSSDYLTVFDDIYSLECLVENKITHEKSYIALPDYTRRIFAINETGDIYCCSMISKSSNGCIISKLTKSGSVIWSFKIEAERADFFTYPIIEMDHIYFITSSSKNNGGTFYKIDLNGNLIATKQSPFIRNVGELIFYNDKIFYLGELCYEDYSQNILIEMDGGFEVTKTLELDMYVYIISNKAVFDRKNGKLIYDTMDDMCVVIDLIHQSYIKYNITPGMYICAVDNKGFIYAQNDGSKLQIMNSDFQIVSKHIFKGDIYNIDTNGTKVYILTAKGDISAWGIPEKCAVYTYVIEL